MTARSDMVWQAYRDALAPRLDQVAEIVRKELGVTNLHEDGREVVVKGHCPGTREIFEQDFKTSRQLAKLIQPEQLMVLDEMQAQFLTEFDF
ncbi:hypothetical protein AMAG_18319 [Allomyces macrogynus ATCC 38327]|uniref:Uncharacterized protein n=1 Tax=Allomyces macrogynus (strain ATCC 38327) TaxID=578462 RepID=A0A0L0S8U7_ALLM3|nr:hypothetical protein AMAG_18319 [Allomyces macrogynus ATCC 38327]|eukprot:KNE58851.1 hypothetical protein AMAG_18319 [Allomyces macrogynus ATCC 38327]